MDHLDRRRWIEIKKGRMPGEQPISWVRFRYHIPSITPFRGVIFQHTKELRFLAIVSREMSGPPSLRYMDYIYIMCKYCTLGVSVDATILAFTLLCVVPGMQTEQT
jgi:hypothetical protein